MNLLIAIIALGLLQAPTPVLAAAASPETIEYSTSTAETIVRAYAVKYGVSGDEMWGTTLCENKGLDPTAQSSVIMKSGKRENSWGNSQINLYWHPEVTKEQAQDPYFSADFMGRYFAAGKQSQWSCWKDLYGDKPKMKKIAEL